jgi:hypothetical protein
MWGFRAYRGLTRSISGQHSQHKKNAKAERKPTPRKTLKIEWMALGILTVLVFGIVTHLWVIAIIAYVVAFALDKKGVI